MRPERAYGPLHRDLEMAHNAVRRLARATAFTEADLAEMRTIAGEARELLRRWTITAVETSDYVTSYLRPDQ